MIVLAATTSSLEIDLAGAVTTNELPVVASFVDWDGTSYTPGHQNAQSNGTTAATIVSAPGASTYRQIKQLNVYNADTAAATVTIQYNDNSTLRSLVVFTLAVGDVIQYTDGEGWRVFDNTGQLKGAGGGGGESNTASNQGVGGVGVFKQKTGVDLEFKNINAGSSKITVTNDAANNEVDIDVAEANLSHDNIGGVSADDHHAQAHAHNGADSSGTVAHSDTTGKTANDHHNQSHDHSAAGDGQTLSPATLNIPSSATPAQTAEGQAVWDSDDDLLTVGNGTGRETFLPVDDAVSNPANVTTASAADGTEATVARKDHVHGIADEAVTYAKMQHISATSKLLGRKTAGAGDVEEVTASEGLDFIGSTRGSVLYRGAAGWAALTPGTSGHVLTSNGSGADPSYQASAGGGSSRDRSVAVVVDEFMFAQDEDGEIGDLGWETGVGTVSGGGRTADHPGIITKSSGASSGINAYIQLTNLSNMSFDSTDTWDMYWIVQVNDVTSVRYRFGAWFAGVGGGAPTNGIYIEFDSASDTNWQYITRSSGTETQTDSGTAAAASTWYRFRIRRKDASTISFSINDGSETDHTTNIPSDIGMAAAHAYTLAASDRSFSVDYFDLRFSSLGR